MGKREQILDAALALFVERGIQGTATTAISQQAGVSAGILFHYFKTKDALIEVLFLETKLTFLTESHAALENFESMEVQQTAREIWQGVKDWSARHPVEFRFLQMYYHSPFVSHMPNLPEIEALEARLDHFFTIGIETGVLKPVELTYLRRITESMLIGLFHYLQQIPEKHSDEDFIEAAWQMFWDSIRL